jgi:peptidyl-prolyl cis-trans isomerase D
MFGTMLVHVAKIEPENVKPFDQVAAEIKQAIATDRARGDIAAIHDKVEDERAAGSRLTEIAQKLSLKARTIDAIDRQGRDPDGKLIGDLPPANLISGVFNSDVGVENEPIQMTGGGYLWFDVLGVKPSRERPLDEVRAQVEERWRQDQIAERLKAKANEIVEKMKGGTSLNDVAAAEGLNVQTTFGIKRSGNAGSMPAAVVSGMFETPKDGVGSAEGKEATERIIFHVTDISVPTFDAASTDGRKIDDAMRRAITEDLLAQYVARLQTDLGATINMDAVRRSVSGGSEY